MPKLENKITLGNALTIALLVFSVAVAWGTANAQIGQVEKEIEDHESRLRVLESQVLTGLARIDERLSRLDAERP